MAFYGMLLSRDSALSANRLLTQHSVFFECVLSFFAQYKDHISTTLVELRNQSRVITKSVPRLSVRASVLTVMGLVLTVFGFFLVKLLQTKPKLSSKQGRAFHSSDYTIPDRYYMEHRVRKNNHRLHEADIPDRFRRAATVC